MKTRRVEEELLMIFDLALQNGRVIDPANGLDQKASLGIKGKSISALTSDSIKGKIELDCEGLVVCPGFIDIHSHVDNHLYSGECYALQGITTTIGGNCGLSPLSPEIFFREMQKSGFPINQGQMVGHSFTLREAACLNDISIPASSRQIKVMHRMAEERLNQGALGISFGLEYAPGSSYKEISTLCKLAAAYDRPVAIHIRYDSWKGLEGLEEVFNLVRQTEVSLLISHLVYMVGMGMMTEALDLIERARNEGLAIEVDSGLYSAFATFIGSAVFAPGCLEKWGCDYNSLYVSTGPYANQQLTRELFEMLRTEAPETVIVAFVGKDEEVEEALLKPYVMVSTDGAVGSPEPGSGHPQDSGTFPRFFRLMVREKGLLSLNEAIRKCTTLPAGKMNLYNKGSLRPGTDADITVFDINTITDTSDYPGIGQPDSTPIGIEHVIVNGTPVVRYGNLLTGSLPGRPVRA
jgi:N-acyl-D-amino-acid deacylase